MKNDSDMCTLRHNRDSLVLPLSTVDTLAAMPAPALTPYLVVKGCTLWTGVVLKEGVEPARHSEDALRTRTQNSRPSRCTNSGAGGLVTQHTSPIEVPVGSMT